METKQQVKIGNYRLTWNAKIAGFRELYFPTFSHLIKYYTNNAQHFQCDVVMWVWGGHGYERFVLNQGKIITESKLRHLLKSISAVSVN